MTRFCEYSATISKNANQNKLDFNSQILRRSEKIVTFTAFELKYRTPVSDSIRRKLLQTKSICLREKPNIMVLESRRYRLQSVLLFNRKNASFEIM